MSSESHDRLEKFKSLADHPLYKRLMRSLTEGEFDEVVEFIDDNADLNARDFEMKVNRFYMDVNPKPKNIGKMLDILIACNYPVRR